MATLAEKLQVKGERRLAVIDAPMGIEIAPDRRADIREAEVALLFALNGTALRRALPVLEETREGAVLWIAYPKLTSPLAGDLHRDRLREAVRGYGLDTVAQIAIDDDWSALRVKRVER